MNIIDIKTCNNIETNKSDIYCLNMPIEKFHQIIKGVNLIKLEKQFILNGEIIKTLKLTLSSFDLLKLPIRKGKQKEKSIRVDISSKYPNNFKTTIFKSLNKKNNTKINFEKHLIKTIEERQKNDKKNFQNTFNKIGSGIGKGEFLIHDICKETGIYINEINHSNQRNKDFEIQFEGKNINIEVKSVKRIKRRNVYNDFNLSSKVYKNGNFPNLINLIKKTFKELEVEFLSKFPEIKEKSLYKKEKWYAGRTFFDFLEKEKQELLFKLNADYKNLIQKSNYLKNTYIVLFDDNTGNLINVLDEKDIVKNIEIDRYEEHRGLHPLIRI